MKITEVALKFKTTIYVLIAFIVIVGAMSYRSLPLEAAPEVKIPVLIVSTVYPGVSPEDMEKLVTNVIEGELELPCSSHRNEVRMAQPRPVVKRRRVRFSAERARRRIPEQQPRGVV